MFYIVHISVTANINSHMQLKKKIFLNILLTQS